MAAPSLRAGRLDVNGPAGTSSFGSQVKLLPNGNLVVVDEQYTPPGTNVATGGVFLFSRDGALISVLTGSKDQDRVGAGGITVLANGNFVVSSYRWDNGNALDAGAVTWGSMTEGVSGVVSAENSLVGSRPNDQVGDSAETRGTGGVIALSNGNYLVCSPTWDDGPARPNAGAVTWADGGTGGRGIVGAGNSLVGAESNRRLGLSGPLYGVWEVGNGNYVVNTSGGTVWGNGQSGRTGVLSGENALISSGNTSVTVLATGDYVVANPSWDGTGDASDNRGAVTWCPGNGGRTGLVTPLNSLVGKSAGDSIGNGSAAGPGVVALTNGNFVVVSPAWDLDGLTDRGAVTWCEGSASLTGLVSEANSVVGTAAGDMVARVLPLTSGDYVIAADSWDHGSTSNAGAVRKLSGTGPSTGALTPENSLTGSKTNDRVSSGTLTALANGNFVISSPSWSKADLFKTGAVTFVNASQGLTGPVTAENSFTGTKTGDSIGGTPDNAPNGGGVTALSNGNYVISSPKWNGSWGAVTWGDGTKGVTGEVTAENSITGVQGTVYTGGRLDAAPIGNITALPNGNFVISSPGTLIDDVVFGPYPGAVTWCSGLGPTRGVISRQNSISSGQLGLRIGQTPPIVLPDGSFLQLNSFPSSIGGFVMPVSGVRPTAAVVSSDNSIGGSILLSSQRVWDVLSEPEGMRLAVGGGPGHSFVSIFYNLSPDLPKFRPRRANGTVMPAGELMDFGEAAKGGTVSLLITVRNPGAAPLTLQARATTDPAFGVLLPENGTVPPGGEALVRINFTPDGPGPRSSVIHLSSNDPDAPEFEFTVNGTGSQLPERFTRDLPAPAGSGAFGHSVTYLPNGNLVVTDPKFKEPGSPGIAGAVYLYSPDGALISKATGEGVDGLGAGGTVVLANGNYLIRSTFTAGGQVFWALTFANAVTGLSSTVSPAKSLSGIYTRFHVSLWPEVLALANGDFVVSHRWGSDGRAAFTRGSGVTGPAAGPMSTENALIGSLEAELAVTVLPNGNFVVLTGNSVTLASGTTPAPGLISELNSLILPAGADLTNKYIRVLTDGNFVVCFPWMRVLDVPEAGAVLWFDGVAGRKGPFQPGEALSGGRFDKLGDRGLFPLPDGGYAVNNGYEPMMVWSPPGGTLKGSVRELPVGSLKFWASKVNTLSDGNMALCCSTGEKGANAVVWVKAGSRPPEELSRDNAFWIDREGDLYASNGQVTVLDDGNYVISSPQWPVSGPNKYRGAVTWCDGRTGRTGVPSLDNSLVGAAPGAGLGTGLLPLEGARYVVRSYLGGTDALTWMSGPTEGAGAAHAGNSLLGPVGSLIRLANGNYVVRTQTGYNGGRVFQVDGWHAAAGSLNPADSLWSENGVPSVYPLANGHFVVTWTNWTISQPADWVTAVTWGDGRKGVKGAVSPDNSIMSSLSGYYFGPKPTFAVASDSSWTALWPQVNNNGAEVAGAAVMGNGRAQASGRGALTFLNSVRGASKQNGTEMTTTYDPGHRCWAVGRPRDNTVSLFACSRPSAPAIALEEPGQVDLAGGSTLDFGLVGIGEFSERKVVVASAGAQALQLGALTLSDPQFQVAEPPSSQPLPVDGRTEMVLRFTPSSPGTQSAELEQSSNDPQQPLIRLSLRGTAKTPADKPFGEGGLSPTVTVASDGKATVRMRAAAGMSYLLQRSQDLILWSAGWLVTADEAGEVFFVDDTPDARSAFYRLQTR